MTEISLETVTGKLNRVGYDAFMRALRQAKLAGHRNVELAHWLMHLLQSEGSDLDLTVDRFALDRARLSRDLEQVIGSFRVNETQMPGVANNVVDALDRGWHFATLLFGETQIRSGHLLTALLKTPELRRALRSLSREFDKIADEALTQEANRIWAGSQEENLRPLDGAGPVAKGAREAKGAHTALDRFAQDLTERARSGELDPVLGRDDEIRQVIDVLMRRRQNNPILIGEAGVGKTAIAEGFAQRIVAGAVPAALRDIRLLSLDIGLLQAGASMKGEFEQRLRSVIDEAQSSPTPVILFIDEAHTLIGAGGQNGVGDAADLLKPALARGALRMLAATTFAEYRRHIEKDPALSRRFQPVDVDEPSVERCVEMLRAMVKPMERHHNVRVSEMAIRSATKLSQRYIPARKLPDKAVSLLDTACARAAISQNATPAPIEDARAMIAALESERAAIVSNSDLEQLDERRLHDVEVEISSAQEKLAELESRWTRERGLIEDIHRLREEAASAEPAHRQAIRERLDAKSEALEALSPERRMIYAHVDEQCIASVVSDWTGVPVGRMVTDEIETVLHLTEILNERVVGQTHGLRSIAKRIETSRARLDNPDKPIGVFMLVGPSGVGKTETALALAEALYGGEQNVITINMSEFQEPHSVATLKGAPPGYVGFGEGGRLTEAVRRKPYSVILLDEIEKAHPDVHEIFFQVFDKGQMEDGAGRRIDFRNTLIILTSNVGTDLLMRLGADPTVANDAEALAQALQPELLRVFPPALLGRIVTVPYFPLSRQMLVGITRLQLDRIGKRVTDGYRATFSYDDTVVDHIVEQCRDPDSGGRMIDNIVTNTLLPALSREFLKKALAKQELARVAVGVQNGAFEYSCA
ncbi:type VI secretion system ATPase TssH [Methylosinus sp. LW3]|uniref:type VI secretion system ATPase TssH n=1 Tax=Methylosinus sp. LW3 TaxID=107635 RepID=UPI000464ABEA|nr:type VI secretion system ATPase TssH [Methylosinus sp. LW3]